MSEQEQHDTSNGVPNEPNDQHHAAPTAHGERHAINPDAAQDDVRGLVLDGRFDDDPPSVGSSNGLEYGALDSQFPATYDPYIYGHPDTDDALGAAAARAQAQRGNEYGQPSQQNAYGQQAGLPYQTQNQPGSGRQGNGGRNQPPFNLNDPSFINSMNQMNPDDPNQNPLYGHWDPGAIIAFVFALILPLPVLPALFGWFSMRRTKIYHMKGYGLSVAALVINVLYTIMWLYFLVSGVSPTEYLNQMLNTLNNGSGGSDSVKA